MSCRQLAGLSGLLYIYGTLSVSLQYPDIGGLRSAVRVGREYDLAAGAVGKDRSAGGVGVSCEYRAREFIAGLVDLDKLESCGLPIVYE